MNEPCCGRCRFGHRYNADNDTVACHRYPPAWIGGEHAGELDSWEFPILHDGDWCGEFQPDGKI